MNDGYSRDSHQDRGAVVRPHNAPHDVVADVGGTLEERKHIV